MELFLAKGRIVHFFPEGDLKPYDTSLRDFKRGVEFMAYATGRLPHARAVAVESDREFGLSVLQRLDAELTRGMHEAMPFMETLGATAVKIRALRPP